MFTLRIFDGFLVASILLTAKCFPIRRTNVQPEVTLQISDVEPVSAQIIILNEVFESSNNYTFSNIDLSEVVTETLCELGFDVNMNECKSISECKYNKLLIQ